MTYERDAVLSTVTVTIKVKASSVKPSAYQQRAVWYARAAQSRRAAARQKG